MSRARFTVIRRDERGVTVARLGRWFQRKWEAMAIATGWASLGAPSVVARLRDGKVTLWEIKRYPR